jgi:hypothetical protein
VIGSSIEKLLREIYPEKGTGVVMMVKTLEIDVSYEKPGFKSKNKFSVSYFWSNVRSKYAHSTGIEEVGSKQFLILHVLKEPSEETTEMSVGLLSVFLKAYLEDCIKAKDENN